MKINKKIGMKTKLFIDVDGVVLNPNDIICKLYNVHFQMHNDFIPAIGNKVSHWDYREQCPLAHKGEHFTSDIISYWFGCDEFWELADKYEPMENSRNIIKLLSYQYDIIFCSIGSDDNISKKALWLKKYFNGYKRILLATPDCNISKSLVDMSDGIFLDDKMSNLESSNAKYKFAFGEVFEWNKYWTPEIYTKNDGRIKNWLEAYTILSALEKKQIKK